MNFISKSFALSEYVKNKDLLICNSNITKYFIINKGSKDANYKEFLKLIKNDKHPRFYEYIHSNNCCTLFFDVEIWKNEDESSFFNKNHDIINIIKKALISWKPKWEFRFLILESHNESKFSYHVICRIKDENENNVVFESVSSLKTLYNLLNFKNYREKKNGKPYNIIDPSVYRDGIFRTIYSSKNEENRPLKKSELSDEFDDDCETFVSFYNYDKYTIFSFNEEVKQNTNIDLKVKNNSLIKKEHAEIIYKFISKNYGQSRDNIREILLDADLNCFVIPLKQTFCNFIEDYHQSNNQYIVIDRYSSKQKCHDELCKDSKFKEIKGEKFSIELADIFKEYFKLDEELIDKAKEECKEFIRANFDNEVEVINFDRDTNTFTAPTTLRNIINFNGKCPKCNVEHQINIDGYCMVCTECSSVFPNNTLIPVGRDYNTLTNFWTQFNIVINNNTIINGEESFNCDVELDNNILNDEKLTKLFNQTLDGHKITTLAEILSILSPNFKYSNGIWYTFNGNIWEEDIESIYMKHNIINIGEYLNKIFRFYENNIVYKLLLDNIKKLNTKLYKPSIKNDIISEAKMFFLDKHFLKLLNSKKHLVPFTNGVYDLISKEFRKSVKEDYINLTLSFDYNNNVNNPEVWSFINKILPNSCIRDWVLKKLSECLNGDIPNTHFLMFIGDGANGKSQLLNLMKLAMGELAEKVEVTLLTRKRNNANEANTEKIKLLNKRFAFLSEPEDGEKINIGLLKELTGSEEIIARGLYQESLSFVMETKLFLACNELPEIKGEDTALWRRIRVVDFPSRFVDEPKESNEYKIDRTLPSRMREDISWRQTFINILLDYYYKEVSEPDEVKMRTNEYRQENSEFEAWLSENVEYSPNSSFELKDICESFLGNQKVHTKTSSKYKKQVENWIKVNYPNENHLFSYFYLDKKRYHGWINFRLKQ
jgi:P4 family phage/plasmid primase-like protien